jgi:hypothetical protein
MRRSGKRIARLARACLTIGLSWAAAGASSGPRSTSTVGMPAMVEQVVLSGTELEVRPIEDRRAPVVLRITAAYPHGSAFRYDLSYYGLEPGEYDLKELLRRKDGTPASDLPPIQVKVNPTLPPGQVEPHALMLGQSPSLGGYRLLLALGGSLWCAGLAAILLLGRHKRSLAEAATSRPVTLADSLRPLVDAAVAGKLDRGQHAELERLLIGYWRRRLNLEQARPPDAIAAMREHPEAGPLLRKLEEWLHRPDDESGPVDVADLLRPYQNLASHALEEGSGVGPADDGVPRFAEVEVRR